jgi:hypothetical protein
MMIANTTENPILSGRLICLLRIRQSDAMLE